MTVAESTPEVTSSDYSADVDEQTSSSNVADSSPEAVKSSASETGTSTTSSTTPTRRYPTRVRRPLKRYQTD